MPGAAADQRLDLLHEQRDHQSDHQHAQDRQTEDEHAGGESPPPAAPRRASRPRVRVRKRRTARQRPRSAGCVPWLKNARNTSVPTTVDRDRAQEPPDPGPGRRRSARSALHADRRPLRPLLEANRVRCRWQPRPRLAAYPRQTVPGSSQAATRLVGDGRARSQPHGSAACICPSSGYERPAGSVSGERPRRAQAALAEGARCAAAPTTPSFDGPHAWPAICTPSARRRCAPTSTSAGRSARPRSSSWAPSARAAAASATCMTAKPDPVDEDEPRGSPRPSPRWG